MPFQIGQGGKVSALSSFSGTLTNRVPVSTRSVMQASKISLQL